MRSTLAALLGGALLVNGILMIPAPETWFELVPGAAESGPFNAHFVRDVGAIYLLGGLAFLWLTRSAKARGAALMAAGFLALHALTHFGEVLASGHWSHLARDVPGVYLPPALALWLTLTHPRPKENRHASVADRPLHRGL